MTEHQPRFVENYDQTLSGTSLGSSDGYGNSSDNDNYTSSEEENGCSKATSGIYDDSAATENITCEDIGEGTDFYDSFIFKAKADIGSIEKNRDSVIASIDQHFSNVKRLIEEEHERMVNSITACASARIVRINECVKNAEARKCSPVGDPEEEEEEVMRSFRSENVYDVSMPLHKVPRVEGKDIEELLGHVIPGEKKLSYLPPPQNVSVTFSSPVSGAITWDESAYEELFNRLNESKSYFGEKYSVNDVKFVVRVEGESSIEVKFHGNVKLKCVPNKKYKVFVYALYRGLSSGITVFELVSPDVSPEFYQGNWAKTSSKIVSKKCINDEFLSAASPILFVGDVPLQSGINNFWALSFKGDYSQNMVLMAGLVPSGVGDSSEPFFATLQKGWFVSPRTGLLFCGDPACMPNGRSCKVFAEKNVLSLGFGARDGSLVLGANINAVKEALCDGTKSVFSGIQADTPLYPAVILASSTLTVELCYPS